MEFDHPASSIHNPASKISPCNAVIFREYDIRGIWGKDLTPEVAELIGRAFGSRAVEVSGKRHPVLTVGRDVRLSSGIISQHLIKGLVSTGAQVFGLGECPTPAQYFSLYHLEADGGIMITGSHNPPEYNGFKMSIGRETIYGPEIKNLQQIIEKNEFVQGAGKAQPYPILTPYAEMLRERFSDFTGIKVVLDAGNGTAGLIAPALIKYLGAEVTELFCEPDGTFPNHHPDPVVAENLTDLIDKVKSTKSHFGIAYDGDADRIGVVDADGEIIWGDRLMIIFSRDILKQNSGATIIGEVKCSQVMYDDIKASGGKPIMWKTGHSLIKKKMQEERALLAGEMSGHLFFADRYFGFDDAIYATLRLLEILKVNEQPYSLKKLLEGLPEVYSTPEIRFDCDDNMKFVVTEKIREAFSDYEVNTTDGARINFGDGWGLVRASNTQPALVLRFEAQDKKRLDEIQTLVETKLQEVVKNQRDNS